MQASYTATITATDGSNSVTQFITIVVTDVDDVAPAFTSSDSFSAAENQTAIGTVTVTDADSASTTLSVSGDDLAITSAGVLSFVAAPDYETDVSYTAVVTATDGVNQATQTITIVVSDIDDEAPTFTSSYVFTVVENQTAIGTVTATDVDSDNGTITFSISGNSLAISDAGVLSFSVAPDFESNASFTATVTATDGVNERARFITVTVTDIDDEAPVFSSSTSFTAAENQTAIGTVSATDVDSDDNAISFSVSGDDLEVTSAGVLSFSSAPDYEKTPSYKATITATDGANQSEQIVTITVTDVNDEAPVITSSATFNALDSQAVLGTVTATDADSVSITFGISGSELAITSAGVISLAAGVDPAGDTSYSAIVTASDGLNLATQAISVAVLLDLDSDGEANATDTDDDGDGILDVNDDYPLIAISYAVKGPLYLARAYHDCNGNESFDEATEPFALTETDGSYHIDGDCGAKTSFNTVIEMTAETIDYESGESYGATAVQLKTEYSVAGSRVNTPLTTLLKHIEKFKGNSDDVNEVAIESISSAQLSLALGLPDTVDLLTFNPYAAGVDATLAHDIETVSQKIMLVTLVVTKAIEGAGTSASGASVTDDIAHEAILDALSKVVIETIKVQEGNQIGHVLPPDASLTGEARRAAQKALKVNLADRDHLVELFEFLDEDAASGHLRFALDAIGADIPVAVLTAITDKTSEIISKIAVEFDGHDESAFSSAETHITSHLKHVAAEEIFAFARGYRAYYDIDQDSSFTGVQPRDFLTLDGLTGIADAGALISAEVEEHALDKITDTDGDGIFDVLDLDDDNDGVADIADAFPRDANESADSDSDGVGDNADTFRLSNTPVTLTDYYPLDGSMVTNTLAYNTVGNMAEVDLRAAPLNLTNIRNAIQGGDFNSPELHFGLSTLPTGSGADTITIDLIDGVDGIIDAGERQVKVDIAVEWESDGTTASITVPTQTINASYKTVAGVQIDVQVANVDADVLTVTNNGVAYPATLEVKLFSLISQLSALPLADILSAGIYHVNVSTSLPLKAATGETLGGVSAIVEIFDAFKLGDAKITLQDINPSDGSVTSSVHETTVVDGFLSVDMRDAPLSLLNIEKGLYGLDFTSPKVLFSLSAIPSGTGTETVTINLIDGTDAVRGAGERQITVALEIEWDADGNAAAITAPAQDLTAYYLTGDGVRFDVALTNADLDVLSVTSAGAGYPASLELKLLSLITKLSGLPLADILSAGEFHLDVTTSMPLISPAGLAVEGLKAVIKIQDDMVPVFTSVASFSAAENQFAVGTVTATAFDSGAVEFSISGSDLKIDAAGLVSFISTPDYEANATYTATVTVMDGDRSTTQVITVTVTDKDDTFTLSDTAVTLTDYYPLDGSTVTNTLAYTVENGKGNVDLRAAPLNLTNIQNALYAGDFKTPVVSFGLSTLPIGSGAGTVSIDLIDGVDGVIDTGERQVKVEIAVEWESDGTTASITVPQQTINASYKTGAGVQIDVQVANVDSDILTVAGDGVAYPATLQVKLVSLITQLSALPLADILSAGIYHVDVSTSLPLKAATGETLSGVSAIIEIADAFKLADAPITLQDSSAVDGSITASDHVTSLVDGFLTVDMRDAPLSLLNIEKGLYGLDFTSPKVLFSLSAIPSGTGTETVTINLIDGTDAVRGAGERQITVALEIEWDADGNAAAITAPAQDLTAYYLTGDGVRFDVALTNADLDVLSVTSAGAGYPASLELKLLSLITKLSGLPLADILSAGEFHLDVTTSMPLISPAGLAVEGLKAIIEIRGQP